MEKAFNFLRQRKEVPFATIDKNENPTMSVFQIMLIGNTACGCGNDYIAQYIYQKINFI